MNKRGSKIQELYDKCEKARLNSSLRDYSTPKQFQRFLMDIGLKHLHEYDDQNFCEKKQQEQSKNIPANILAQNLISKILGKNLKQAETVFEWEIAPE